MTERSVDRLEQAPEEARQQWLGMLQTLSDQIQRQQENSQQMTQEMMETYSQLLNTPGSYFSGQAEQQQQTFRQTTQQWMEQAKQQRQTFQQQAQQQQQAFKQMTQEVMNTYAQLFNIPLSYARKGLQDAGFPIENYDDLNAGDISKGVGGLSVEEIRVVRDYEERNKNRDTVLEQLDRRIRSGS